MRWANVQATDVKFSQDLIHQKSLKLANFWQQLDSLKCKWLQRDATRSGCTVAVMQMFAMWCMTLGVTDAYSTTVMLRMLVSGCRDGWLTFSVMTWCVYRSLSARLWVRCTANVRQYEYFLGSRVRPRQHALLVNAAERLLTTQRTHSRHKSSLLFPWTELIFSTNWT